MFIPSRNRGWSSGARTFTLQTAASIVTASNYAPITRPTISSGNGATAAAHRAITFSSGQCSSVKCDWARIFRTSVRERQPKGRAPHPLAAQVLPPRPGYQRRAQRLREQLPRLLQQLRLRRKERRSLVRHLQHQVRLHPRIRLRQLPQRRQVRRHRKRQRALLRRLLQRLLQKQPSRVQVRPHHQIRQEHRGQCRRPVNR